MRSTIKVLLVVIGVIMIIPVYLTVDIFLHRNENYVEYGYDLDLLSKIFSSPESHDHGVWADVVEVFPSGKRLHATYPYSRKGYRNHGIMPIKRITNQAELSDLHNLLGQWNPHEEAIPSGLEEQAVARYDVFFQFPTGIGIFSIYQIGNRFCLDNQISAPYWIEKDIIQALGIPEKCTDSGSSD